MCFASLLVWRGTEGTLHSGGLAAAEGLQNKLLKLSLKSTLQKSNSTAKMSNALDADMLRRTDEIDILKL